MVTKKKTTKKKATKKASKVEEKITFMGLLKKVQNFAMKIVKPCWDFLKVGDACSFVVGGMALWLLWLFVSQLYAYFIIVKTFS
tara:strand:- start:154 stop:405 length:252 start_codon:yes stop_codon:yes gene_type:complete